jgi:hypothetical protein
MAASCLLLSTPVFAEIWYFEPVANARLGYDDNVRLTTRNSESAFSGLVNVSAPFGVRSEVSDIKMEARLESRRFEGLSDLDADDLAFSFDANRIFELDRLRLRGALERDSTRVTELETTGAIQSSTPRKRMNINPSWTRQLSERIALELGYDYTDVSYDDAELFGLVDYEYQFASAELTYKLTERNLFLGALLAADFDASDTNTEQTTYGARIGIEREFSETFKGRFLVGFTHTESDFINDQNNPVSSDDNDVLLDVSIEKDYETFRVKGTFGTRVAPTGRGRMLRKDAIGFRLVRDLSDRAAFKFDAQWFKNESAGGIVNDNDDRVYYSLMPTLTWRATRWWTIESSYRYRIQEYTETGDGEAESNAVFLTARYQWPREGLAR